MLEKQELTNGNVGEKEIGQVSAKFVDLITAMQNSGLGFSLWDLINLFC